MKRRQFLKNVTLGSTALYVLPELLLKDPYAPFHKRTFPSQPIRVQGKVTLNGFGIQNVSVTDGYTVVQTDNEGNYTLLSDIQQPFVYISLPSHCKIPQNSTGTAKFYQLIQPNNQNEATAFFELYPAEEEVNHAFLALADPQTQTPYEMQRFQDETISDIQTLLKEHINVPCFGVSCGDIMFDNLELYADYEKGIQQTTLPFFQVVGNHDLDFKVDVDGASTQTFSQHFGPRYYSFNRGQIHYIVLDDVFWFTQGYIGYLEERQLHWLKQDLATVEAGKTVVVFTHIPADSTLSHRAGEGSPSHRNYITNRHVLYRLLEPYNAHIITGHTHENEHAFNEGTHEQVVGTVCGAWWSGHICADGTPNGYKFFEVKGDTLSWRYKSTGEPINQQMRLYAQGANADFPNDFVVNVWDWDPAWKVFWYEEGIRRGEMQQRTTTDPLSERLHRGADVPDHRPWVEPYNTHHMFYAPAPPVGTLLEVEVVDRWGNIFRRKIG